jgi:hypothetical protein
MLASPKPAAVAKPKPAKAAKPKKRPAAKSAKKPLTERMMPSMTPKSGYRFSDKIMLKRKSSGLAISPVRA